jgi:predicted ribosome quality control (RQC) complex YloA/Tae2 family protein
MVLNGSDLALVIKEIFSVLRGGWIQKIQQPGFRTVVFDIRVPGQTHRLLMSCEPDSPRLHLTTRPHLNPPTPPPFCQFLRAHFQGARLDDLRQIGNDRIVELLITGKEGLRTMVCELTGKKANILVLDACSAIWPTSAILSAGPTFHRFETPRAPSRTNPPVSRE